MLTSCAEFPLVKEKINTEEFHLDVLNIWPDVGGGGGGQRLQPCKQVELVWITCRDGMRAVTPVIRRFSMMNRDLRIISVT